MKSISESMREFKENEKVNEAKIEAENGRHEYPYKGKHWPVEVRADIDAKGGMKGKGTKVSLFLKDENGKAVMKGFQGPATMKSISDLVKKWADKGLLPNEEAEGFNEESDIDGVIKALVDAKPSDDNAEQGKFVSLMKGLAFSDDPKATAFMKKLMGAIDSSFVGGSKNEENIMKACAGLCADSTDEEIKAVAEKGGFELASVKKIAKGKKKMEK